eukprot:3587526-Pleurochrysis_carterae.AAC.2
MEEVTAATKAAVGAMAEQTMAAATARASRRRMKLFKPPNRPSSTRYKHADAGVVVNKNGASHGVSAARDLTRTSTELSRPSSKLLELTVFSSALVDTLSRT